METRDRYTLNDIVKNTFYQMPKFLFTEEFKKLNNDARVLYSVLKDRHELSVKNKWTNENNEVYIIFSREEMCEALGLSENTILKAMNALKKYELIQEERQGMGRPNKIFLLTVKSPIIPHNRNNCGSSNSNFEGDKSQDLRNLPYINKTYDSDTNHSQRQTGEFADEKTEQNFSPAIDIDNDNIITNINNSENEPDSASVPTDNTLNKNATQTTEINYTYDTAKQLIHKNIDYYFYKQHRNIEIDLIDELVDCMLDVMLTKSNTVKINGEDKDRQLVIRQYLKINSADIDLVSAKYKEQQHKITHIHSYLKTMLYIVKQENGHYYTNSVRVDNPYLF